MIGLSNGRGIPLERMVAGDVSDAQAWEVYDFGEGKLGVALEPSIGHGVIYKLKPTLDSQGRVIPTPLAAKQLISSIIRAIEACEGPAKK